MDLVVEATYHAQGSVISFCLEEKGGVKGKKGKWYWLQQMSSEDVGYLNLSDGRLSDWSNCENIPLSWDM